MPATTMPGSDSAIRMSEHHFLPKGEQNAHRGQSWSRSVVSRGIHDCVCSGTKGCPKVGITLASEPWILAFDAKDFAVKKNELQPDGRAYLLAENQKTDVTLSVYLEKVSGAAIESDCDESQKQRLGERVDYKREMVVTKKSAGMTIVEFTIPEIQGVPIQQRNLFACLSKDDVYADIHLSKVTFKPQDEKLFSDILDSVHFVPNSAPGAN